jgi:exosortase
MTLYRELQRQPWLIKLNLILLFLLFVAISVLLWPHWQHNPDLSHGMFMPVLFLLLLRESRLQVPPRYLHPHRGLDALTLISLLAGLSAMIAGGLYSASVGWNHTLVAFSLTVAIALYFFAGLLVLSNRRVRLMPINWTSLVAMGLWLLSAPIPPGTYTRLTLSLQLMVTQNVLSALHLLGIPASRHGNIIELANTSVGVAEACSGVRSLISCIFAGFFFSATLVTKPWARVLIIVLAAPLAVLMNFLRSLLLTLMANRGVDISGTWHDVTGFAVLGFTAVILGGVALLLDQRKPSEQAAEVHSPAEFTTGRQPANLFLTIGLTGATLLAAFFFIKTRPLTRGDITPPNLLEILPAEAAGWHTTTSNEVYQFSGILETDNLAQRTYRKRHGNGEIQLTVYLAFWQAGQSSVSQVAMHTPDACWPGSGWSVIPTPTPRETLQLPGMELPVAESRLFRSGPYPQHVWFWHVYDGRPIAYEDPYSAAELLRIAWRHGFTRNGDQLFVRVSSNVAWDELAHEPLLQQIFHNLQPLGL